MADSVLSYAAAQAIRQRRSRGERGIDLAAEYGVSPQLVCDIVHNRRWTSADADHWHQAFVREANRHDEDLLWAGQIISSCLNRFDENDGHWRLFIAFARRLVERELLDDNRLAALADAFKREAER